MLTTLLGAIVVAVSVAGIVSMFFRFIIRRPAPKGVIPVAAGVAMLGFTGWLEQSWFERNSAGLPPSSIIVEQGQFSNIIQPWTLIWPRINSYVVVDPDDKAQVATDGEIWETPMFRIQRYTGVREFRLVVNCTTNDIVGLPVFQGVVDRDSQDARSFGTDGNFGAVRDALCASA
ncbi:MAG: hypothetical protein AAF940_08615 [Pseudomonadota bacterium]